MRWKWTVGAGGNVAQPDTMSRCRNLLKCIIVVLDVLLGVGARQGEELGWQQQQQQQHLCGESRSPSAATWSPAPRTLIPACLRLHWNPKYAHSIIVFVFFNGNSRAFPSISHSSCHSPPLSLSLTLIETHSNGNNYARETARERLRKSDYSNDACHCGCCRTVGQCNRCRPLLRSYSSGPGPSESSWQLCIINIVYAGTRYRPSSLPLAYPSPAWQSSTAMAKLVNDDGRGRRRCQKRGIVCALRGWARGQVRHELQSWLGAGRSTEEVERRRRLLWGQFSWQSKTILGHFLCAF